MSCYLDNDGDSLRGVLIFKRDDLLYDIKNYAYIEGSVLETDSGHSRHMVQDVGEEGNVDRVTRVLDLAMVRCREMLYPYTKHAVRRPVLDDRLKEPTVYGIVVSVPEDFSQTSLDLLERLIHEYLVCMAVSDWMSITNPGKMKIWREKADEASAEIVTTLNARRGRVRIRMHPF